MKIKSQQDFFSGLMFLAVGLLFAYGATEYPMGVSARPGPGYFPMILSVLMAILGGLVLINSLTVDTQDGAPIGDIAWRPLLIIVASIILFGIALPRLGLVVTIPLLVALVSVAGPEFSWKGVLSTCAVLTVFSWLVFVKGLNLIIPMWPAFLAL